MQSITPSMILVGLVRVSEVSQARPTQGIPRRSVQTRQVAGDMIDLEGPSLPSRRISMNRTACATPCLTNTRLTCVSPR